MGNEKLLVLSDDKKAVCLKSIKDLFFAAKQLHDWLDKDELTQEMSGILPSLIESHFSEIAKALNYESVLTKEKTERHQQIRKANERIRVLEKQLGEGKPIDGLKEQLKYLADIVSKWWDVYGFHHVSDEVFSEHGHYKARFCFMLDHISMYSDTPETDKKNAKDRINQLIEEGYDIVFENGDRHPRLIDNDNNRTRVVNLIQSRFPSAKVWTTKNHYDDRNGVYFFRDVEVYIYDLRDIPVGTEN
ncbi:hypothetical protein DFQ01_103216 [Paenibacillus cellulosilyticus]|uniref:Uncharacterized protein n=1 Tax=Paenibacillus cellulosilyticus TaxID=375489 RepID=A0A2V2YXH0_9BACL|nr:hypothetical protein [Paenibacillus cellulosilyticus]PWW06314.1 hypothetical protein DFQ01_103216 [Paenibacillus cellulosilyticus]QKS42942.1 hypothetical protein HUB94_00120 [Paenibacillus cellulosilyticus]QKS43465.1 hypothetical protein HUB94_02785 [Paenibacillus cellulosilyticus]QKS46326.1 hypothetical protein HUB94_19150 [Paenibacillus cellulosilyticus]